MSDEAPQPERQQKKPSLQDQLDIVADRIVVGLSTMDCQLRCSGQTWYVYADGVWRPLSSPTDVGAVDDIMDTACRDVGLVLAKDGPLIWTSLRVSSRFRVDSNHFDRQPFVAMRNGTINVATGELVGWSPSHMTTRQVPVDYVTDATCPEWEAMLERIFGDRSEYDREQIIGLLQEWFGVAVAGGSAVRTPRALKVALFLYGKKWTGKSTILGVLRAVFGAEAGRICASSLSDVRQQYGLDAFIGAQAWITEEATGAGTAVEHNRIKCLITGEPLAAQRKYLRDAIFSFQGPVAWAANELPTINESSSAFYDRVLQVETTRTFSREEAKAKFCGSKPEDWLVDQGELPGILAWALAGFERAMKRGHFERVARLEEAVSTWRASGDGVFAFLRECCEYDPEVSNNSAILTGACAVYLRQEFASFKEFHKIREALRSAIGDVIPGVSAERVASAGTDDSRAWTYLGLRLNAKGLLYYEAANETYPSVSASLASANSTVIGSTARGLSAAAAHLLSR